MLVTINAKSIEDIKFFISRQKEIYKVPYEIYRIGQYIFGGNLTH